MAMNNRNFPAGMTFCVKSISVYGRLGFIWLLALYGHASAATLSLSKMDKILILAPHPDDETIGAGGVIQKAMALKIPLKIVYLTNGENNELAFLVFKKHPVLDRSGLLKMGTLRSQEATEAMQSFGFNKSQLVFLGYPDFGTMKIFTKYWGDTKSFKSLISRVSAVPYQNAFSYNLPYKGESIDRKSVV